MATTQPIRSKQQVRELAEYYLKRGELRNHALILLGVHTALRISDLLRLRWEDIYDFENCRVRVSFDIVEKKTRKAKTIALNKAAAEALAFQNRISCHSLRKTFGYHAWKCGVSPAVIMEIYNHSSFAVTRRYLGVTQDDKNEVYLGLELTT